MCTCVGRRTILLFSAVAFAPGMALCQAPGSGERSAQVPAAVYSRLFREVVNFEAKADRLAAKGQPDAAIRHHHQVWLGLTSEQEAELKQVAADWARQNAPLDVQAASARSTLQRVRRESSGAAVAIEEAGVKEVAARQVALSRSGGDALATAFGPEAFASFESVMARYTPRVEPTLGAAKVHRVEPHDCPEPGSAPTYMIILTDTTGRCGGCNSTVARVFTYQVMVSAGQPWSGPKGAGGAMCETNQTSGWNCGQSAPVETSSCSDPSLFVWTDQNGVMTGYDKWSLNSDSFTPVGCGWNTSDLWNALAGSQVGVGAMGGYVHTNAINVNSNVSTLTQKGTLGGTCVNSSGTIPCPK